MKVLTLARRSQLPQAIAFGRSLMRFEPEWPFEIVVLGAPPAEVDGGFSVVGIGQRLGHDPEGLLSRHDQRVLTTYLTAELLRDELRRGAGGVLILPPTAWVLDSLEPLAEAIRASGVLLTRRSDADPPADGSEPTGPQLLDAGRVPPDTIGVADLDKGRAFTGWWLGRIRHAYGDLADSTWKLAAGRRRGLNLSLELAAHRFPTAVLDPCLNLSAWNVHELDLAATSPLLVQLDGFDPDRPFRIGPASSRTRLSRLPALRELLDRYGDELRRTGWGDPTRRRDIGRVLPDGQRFDETTWRLYARAFELGVDLGDPFTPEGCEAFMVWLETAPAGDATPGISRYLYDRLMHERPDVIDVFGLIDHRNASFLDWCRDHGQRELGAPGRFMPRRSTSPDDSSALDPEAPVEVVHAAFGVRVTGYLGHTLGLGSAARGYVRALRAAGVPVSTVTVALDHLQLPAELAPDYGRHTYGDAVDAGGRGFELVCVNPDELPAFVERLGADYFQGPRIGVWGWETDAIPQRWNAAFALVDEIWVYSQFMAEHLGAACDVPVQALAPPVQAPDPPADRLRLGVPDGYLFLFVFDYLSTLQRKNPVGLINAFKRAFAPGQGPQLLLKTINAPLRPLGVEELLWAADGRPDIHLVDRSLSESEKDGLIAACDCYVSLHRSEGFGLTMAEAMSVGKPVIGTRHSGNLDFMDDENSYLVDCELTHVGPDVEIYPAEGRWAEPDVDHAAALMRRVYEDQASAQLVGERARADIARRLSPAATGAAMCRRLAELAAPVSRSA